MFRRRKIWRLLVVLAFAAAALGSIFYTHPIDTFVALLSVRLRLAGVKSDYVAINGHRIHYYVRGPVAGEPVVLIHGLAGRAEDWTNLAPYLVREGYRVYTPDLLGFGRSEQPADATYSIAEQAALVAAFFDAMHLKQTDLAGWSMGGWIAQKVAIDHPDRIRRLILLDSAGLRMPPDWDTRLLTPTSPEEVDQLDALLMPKPPKLPGFLARDMVRHSEKNAWVVKRALASMLTAQDVTNDGLTTLRMPVLLLWGDQDHITPLSEGRAIHQLIPQSLLAITPGCGHLAPEQCALSFGPALVQYLRAEPAPSGGEVMLSGGSK